MSTSNKPLQILHIMSGFGGGISSFIMNKAKEMPRFNVQFDILTFDECNDEFTSAIEQTGGHIYSMSNPKKYGWETFQQEVKFAMQSEAYEIVHCHIQGYRMMPFYRLAKKYTDAKFYVHAHYIKEGGMHHFVKTQQKMNQKINTYASTKPIGCGREAIQAIFGKGTTGKILPNSIDETLYNWSNQEAQAISQKIKADYNIQPGDLVIGHIGRLNIIKNHQKTLHVLAELKRLNAAFKCLIIGSGPLEEELKNKVAELDLEDNVIFTGRVAPIVSILPVLDIAILPSLSEGLPTTVVETQAAGIPILMADTITTEVDFGMGLVEALSLDEENDIWAKALLSLSQKTIPKQQERLAILEKVGYTNIAAGEIYVDFFTKELGIPGGARQ